MDRIWQWAWDRYGPRYYIWWLCAAVIFVSLPIYSTMVTLPIIAFEKSSRYSTATAATVAAVVVLAWVMILPSLRWAVLVKRWGAGQDVDPQPALEATYTYARTASSLVVWVTAVWAAVLSVGIGAIAGAPWARLTQYGFRGALIGAAVQLIAYRSIVEGTLRPVRIALIGDSGIGDTLPRSRPTFAARSNLAMIAVALGYGVAGAMLATAFHSVSDAPFVSVVIGGLLTIVFAVPVTVGLGFSQSLKPIRDLAAGAERVALGDYNQPLPVV
jgi:adenylate cyclase